MGHVIMSGPYVQFFERGDRVAARITLPSGRTFTAVVAMLRPGQSLSTLGAGRIRRKIKRKLKKGLQKVGKVAAPIMKIAAPVLSVASIAMPALAPAAVAAGVVGKVLSKATQTAKKVRSAVNNVMPAKMAKINASNASPTLKLVAAKRVRAALTAKAIASTTAKLPPAQKKIMQRAVVVAAKADQRAVDAAKTTALARAVAKARAATKPNPRAYIVTRPDGQIVNVPIERVM
jgi:hypothetical protein